MQEFFANFQFIDYVLLGICALVGVFGAIKGFLRRIITVLGIVLTILLTSWLCKYPREWLSSVIGDASARSILALIITFVVMGLVVAFTMKSLENKIHNIEGMKMVDVLLGFLIGVGLVYVVVGVVWNLAVAWSENAGRLLKAVSSFFVDILKNSYLVSRLFTDNAFIQLLIQLLFGV